MLCFAHPYPAKLILVALENLVPPSHLARPPDPPGKYSADIVAAVEEKEARHRREICGSPNIVWL